MKRSADSVAAASGSYEHNMATPGSSADGSRKKARRDVSDTRSMSPLTATAGGMDEMDEEDEDESPDPVPGPSSSSASASGAPPKAKATRGSR